MFASKAVIFVLVFALLAFALAKPIALKFSLESDYNRRRNVWLVLTVMGFLSPNFWVFAAVAAPLLIWAGRRDSNPIALYLLVMLVIPSIPFLVPMVGINYLFELDLFRLLAFCVLIPAARRWRRSKDAVRIRRLDAMDWLLIAFGVQQFLTFVPPDNPAHLFLQDSATSALRRAFMYFVDVYVLYYAISRSCSSRAILAEALAAFCLSCVVIAPMAVYESLHHWLLYADIVIRWTGQSPANFYLFRGGTLRAQVSAGHALTLGYLLAVGFGFWLYLQSRADAVWKRLAVALMIWAALIAAYSRGPWLTAAAIYFAFAMLGPRAASRVFKAAAAALLVLGLVLVSPLGDTIIKVLPFMGGGVDAGSLVYRQDLANRSWQLIQSNPILGDPYAYSKMDDLRQGQGIIDLVNTYAQIALFYGFLGLSLFLGPFLLGIFRVHRAMRSVGASDPDQARLGASLIACMVGTLIMIATASLGGGTEKMYYVLTALAAGYVRMGRAGQEAAAPATATVQSGQHV